MSKIISRLWLGPKEMPEKYIEYGKKWQELNPDWEVIEWTPQNLSDGEMFNTDVLVDIHSRGGPDSIEAAVQKADVIGYNLIWEYGGIYLNVDIEPVRPLSYMFDYYGIDPLQAYASREDWNTPRIVNAVLGGPPKHPFWKYVIEKLPEYYWRDPQAEMVETTGPVLLTDCANMWNKDMNFSNDLPLKVMPHKAFNLAHWSRIPLGSNADGRWVDSEEVIAIHHWGHKLTGRTNIVGKR